MRLPTIALLTVLTLSCAAAQRSRKTKPRDIRGKIKGNITGDTYSPNFGDIPPGASSLAFVFDITGSMWDDLRQVIAGARQILETTLNRQEKPLYNYILVPFHDPMVGETIVTSNPDTFTRSLKDLYVQGGGDCPEMSVTAIREALLVSLPGSFVYVFTDAISKDFVQLPEVLQIIQRKQSQVVFVLTGDCDDKENEGYKAYEKIAATSSGQVFLITKDDVSKVVKFIELSVQAHKVVLLAADHDEAGRHIWNIPFDPELQEVTISISGEGRNLQLIDPNGRTITEENGMEVLLNLNKVFIANIKEPEPGNWRLVVDSTGEHTLRVTGLSILDFQSRFSRKPTFNWLETEFQPVAGIDTFVLINATGLPPPGRFMTLNLLDIHGVPIRSMELSTPRDPKQPYLYTVDPFIPPNQPFHMSVRGFTHDHFPFIRATKNAVINILPVKPVVKMPETHPGYFDYPAEIPCHITSLLPYNVQWSRKIGEAWIPLGSPQPYHDSTTDYYRIEEVSEAAEGMYKCFANNSKGSDEGTTFLDVEERPPVITVHGNVTVIPGGNAILTCHVVSNVEFEIRWSRVDGKHLHRRRFYKLGNGSLLVRNAAPRDEAMYQCSVVNIGGESTDTIALIVERPPQVTITPSERTSFTQGKRIRVECRATGLPNPTIAWLKGTTYLLDIGKIRIGRHGGYMEVINADVDDEGVYTCRAENRAGVDQASVQWDFTEKPIVSIEQTEFLVLEGTSVTLACDVAGIPKPTVTWSKSGRDVVTGRSYEVLPNGNLLINRAARSDSDIFTCTATNSAGSDSGDITLQVGWLPVITQPPLNIGVDIGLNVTLSCVADGYPLPSITWFKGATHNHAQRTVAEVNPRVRLSNDTNDLSITALALGDEGAYTCTATNTFGSTVATAQLSVTGTAIPRVDVGNQERHVILSKSIKIPCRILSGNPAPSRSWYKNRELFQPSGRTKINDAGSIVITNARRSDAASYVCSASNVIGTDSKTVNLDVWVPPQIFRGEDEMSTVEGREVTIPCVSVGNPIPSVSWTKKGVGVALNNQIGYRVGLDGGLTLFRPGAQDKGIYTCNAKNDAGSDSIDVSLDVYLKPRSGENNEVYTVTEGNPVTMQCKITRSDPPPTYTWVKDDITTLTGNDLGILIADNGDLTIFTTAVSDAGQYKCVATNIAGSAERVMRLNVQVPPAIRRGPSLIKLLVGETAILNCYATGLPTPSITWYRGEIVMDSEYHPRFAVTSSDGSSELRINDAQLTDDDDYHCVARNPAGNDRSSVIVDVQRVPTISDLDCIPSTINGYCEANPIEQGSMSLSCNATGDPKPVIRWYFEGEEVDTSDPNANIDADGTLTLRVVTSRNNGEYVCEAENERGIVRKVNRVVVHERPEIDGESGEIEMIWIREGEDVDMLCEANAVPPPVITWFSGEQMKNPLLEERDHIEFLNKSSVFRLTNARVSDTGFYKCEARNKVGSTTKRFRLDVYVVPRIRDNDGVSRHQIQIEESVELMCQVDGIPFPTIRWFKGLQELSVDNERLQIDDRGQVLRINSALVTDTASYKCIAHNVAGEDSKNFDLDVYVPPSITGQDQTHTVTVNDRLVLTCYVSGIPFPTVTWTRDGEPLTSGPGVRVAQKGQAIEFDRIRVEDEAVYVCTATSVAGSDQKTHLVNVQVPPSIDGDGEAHNVSVPLGGNVTLTCDASGDPPPTIVWIKDGIPIFSADNNVHISDNGRRLTITDAQETNRGQYSCVASNRVGVETQVHNLDVLVPPVIANRLERIIAVQHEAVTIRCQVYGHPFPEIRWEIYGRPVTLSDRISIEGTDLVISDVEVDDAAVYTCTAENIVGRSRKQATLVVHVPASIIYPVKNQVVHTVIEGRRYELRCAANGIPIPSIKWTKNSRRVKGIKFLRLRDNGGVVQISKADVGRHEGSYECVATNRDGSDSRQMSLVVYVPPVIQGHTKDRRKVIDIGRSEVLECRIKKGKPTPEIKWYNRDNQQINATRGILFTQNKQRLHIISAKLSDVGSYWCEASNIAGKSRKDFHLDVIVPPKIRGQGDLSKVNVILDRNVTMECHVTGIPPPVVTWLKDGIPLLDVSRGEFDLSAGGTRLKIVRAQESQAGRYTCVATNNAGNSSKDFDAEIFLPPSVDGDRVVNITVIENTPVTMQCDINAYPPPAIAWFKDSRPLLLRPGLRLSNDDRQLDIAWAHEHDAGMYFCEATNVAGKQRKYFRLRVHVIPTISGPPHRVLNHVVGDRIHMVCDPDGVPRPVISWTKDDGQLPRDSSLLSDGRVLDILSAKVEHSGTFVCNASNVAGHDERSYEVIVNEPPSIADNSDAPIKVVVNKDDRLVLECLVTGTPTPDITWLKNRRRLSKYFDKALITDNGRFLVVERSDIDDAGKYTCVARNSVGDDRKSFDVDVNVPPSIRNSEEREDRWVAQGNNISLTCDAEGFPVPEIQWLVNGEPLRPSLRVKFQSSGRVLFVSNARDSDAALYSCVVTNVAGSSQRDIKLDVYSSPSITGSDVPSRHDVNQGSAFTLECEVTGVPPPEVEWLKNGFRIATSLHGVIGGSSDYTLEDNGRYLMVASAKLQHSGDYLCRAFNQAGDDSKQHQVNVRVPPSISEDDSSPDDVTSHVNTPTLLRCSAYGIPSPSIKWMKDGVDLDLESDENVATQFEGRYLRIFNTELDDEGTYTCVASNDAGQVSKSFNLHVNVPPLIEGSDQATPNTIGVPVNDTATLHCTIIEGNPFPQIKWWKGRVQLEPGSRLQILNKGQVLEIENSRTADTSRYRCVASNVAGDDRKTFDVEVQVSPNFKDGNTTDQLNVNEGSPLHIHCKIDAVPAPTLVWLKDGRELSSDEEGVYIFPGKRTLQIVSARPSDAGLYTCVATNKVGSDEKDTRVLVNVAPTIGDGNRSPVSLEPRVGDDFTLDCPASGNPEPTIKWYKNGVVLDLDDAKYDVQAGGRLLTVSDSHLSDSGHYVCRAKNKAGRDNKVFRVNVRVPPTIAGPAREQRVALLNSAIVLVCDARGTPEPRLSWTKDGQPLNRANSRYSVLSQGRLLIVLNVQTSDNGAFACVATNPVGQATKTYDVITHVAPVLPKSVGLITVHQGEAANISCEVNAFPVPDVHWTKNGFPIGLGLDGKETLSSKNQVLTIHNAQEEDVGNYICSLSNAAGIASRNFKLTVYVPPRIEGPTLSNRTANLGSSLTLNCDVYAVPKAQITWFKGTEEVLTDDRVTVWSNGAMLQISRVEEGDTGLYTCHASNDAGDAVQKTNLEVHVPPSIVTSSRDVDVIKGETALLECLVIGTPLPAIKWYKGGALVTQNSRGNIQLSNLGQALTIFDAEVSDGTEYVCEATNVAGKETASFDVNVFVPPKLRNTNHTDHTEVLAGDQVTLECEVEGGFPSPEISWFKDGIAVRLSDRIKVLAGGTQLKILSAHESDTATYTCTATNEAGSVSDNFKLDVYNPPMLLSEEDQEITVFVGQSVMLDCSVTGIPTPAVTWSKDERVTNVTTRTSSRVRTLLGSQQMFINSAEVEDTGRYTCVAFSIAGSTDKNFDVNVYDRTRIRDSDQTERISVNVGERFELNCEATATPIPVITWSKDELSFIDSSRISGDGSQMVVLSAQLSDSGKYTCVATSPAGTTDKDFDVTVNLPPSIDGGTRNVTAVVGDNVTLECRSDAVPPPVWSWFKNGRKVDNTKSTLTLLNVRVEEAGEYTCVASNIAGTTSQDIELSVYEPPTIDDGPESITAVLGETVKLPCVADGVPTPKVSWRKDTSPISSTNKPGRFNFLAEGSILVEGIKKEDSGRYVCLVSNGAGSARRVIQVNVNVPPTILPGSTNVTVIVNNPVTLDCEVTGLPRPSVQWLMNGEVIDIEGGPAYGLLSSGSLRITSSAERDTGNYRCVVKNPAGQTYRDITLFVQVPPSIADAPKDYTKEPGMYLRIPCDVSGTPFPEVTWTRNGRGIDSLHDIYVDSQNGLVFTSISYFHDALYTCTALNVAGRASYSANLNVRVRPTIADAQKNWTVFEGDSITLPCDVSGVPDPVVTWRKGAAAISRQDLRFTYMQDNSLLISVAQTDDVGTFTCVAQNPAGVAQSQLHLDVYTNPQFETSFPEQRTINEGEALSLQVTTSGHPKPEVIWSKNGVVLESIDGTLQIPIVLLRDEGLYSVTARNLVGTATRYFRLVVQSPPTIQPTRSPEVVVNEGDQMVLGVSVDGKPLPTVTWTKDGLPLAVDDRRVQQDRGGSVLIQNSRSLDSGRYIATAFNDAGRKSVEFEVLVRVSPVFIERPEDTEVEAGERFQLFCRARGIPDPGITWRFNGQEVPGDLIEPGHSKLVVDNARPADGGRYLCEARNPAGFRNAIAFVTVQSPPVLDGDVDPVQVDTLGGNSLLDCPVRADPLPVITWKKNGQEVLLNDRVRQLTNGSLLIYHTVMNDAADYTCIAVNDVGSIEMNRKLTLEMRPRIVVGPEDSVVDAGESILLGCEAIGEPKPQIYWTKNNQILPVRATILLNSSLLLISSRLEDTGKYECVATNFMGSAYSEALVTVRVHGGFGDWGLWGPCSATCGIGEQERRRECDSPAPANGGNRCRGLAKDHQQCQQSTCPVNGQWSFWSDWEDCSATCGRGTRSRSRECNKPSPQNGGLPCNGEATERSVCIGPRCSVDGGWSSWGKWQPCSRTCGDASQIRSRLCNNPSPSGGGKSCTGSDTSSRVCVMLKCPVNGVWSEWGPWDVCSVSCGGGQRNRVRTCTNPSPSSGGEPCPGSNVQQDNCNAETCSVDGNWASWGPWSECSRSCGGGQSKRHRSCSNPPPKRGKYCAGPDTKLKPCGLRSCPIDGGWSLWTTWGKCSKTCGSGVKTRGRRCNSPSPRNGGSWCPGDASQTDVCKAVECSDRPSKGEGILFGTVNGIPFGGSDILATGTEIGDDKTRIRATITDIPPSVGPALQSQISILTPIYWAMAREIEGAYNGYTLTGGVFDRDVMVEFASGDVVKMKHRARGLDSQGKLKMEVEVSGDIPAINPFTAVDIKDYTEDYVQTGVGSLYAYSDRLISLDGYIMPYTWNHSITYNGTRGPMPYLVERLSASDIRADYNIDREELNFQIDVTIGRGDPSDRCPEGFVLHSSGTFCKDLNECRTERPCSHICLNTFGSYSCSCPTGYYIGWDGITCKDIDECASNEVICNPVRECLNTLGSYRCVITCLDGMRRSENGLSCEDIDECEDLDERVCDHECDNTIGSYFCTCRHGFREIGRGRCEDIDECRSRACRDDQRCVNTIGGYRCIDDCPTGMEKPRPGAICVDINECLSGRHECGRGMICRNTNGGYSCTCPIGYKATGSNPPCADMNECREVSQICQFSCNNTIGSYKCICPVGYRLAANLRNCEDINECEEGLLRCLSHQVCFNQRGSATCLNTPCPPNYKRTRGGYCLKNCFGDDCHIKPKYAIEYKTVSFPFGIGANTNLVRLVVRTSSNELHLNTRFVALDTFGGPFSIRTENHKGVVYTTSSLDKSRTYHVEAQATSYTPDNSKVEYQTKFIIYINIAAYRF